MATRASAEVQSAFTYIDWSALLEAEDGAEFPVRADGRVDIAKRVQGRKPEDADYDTKVHVIVQVGERFFRKNGWLSNSSHCFGYDDGDLTWDAGLDEVKPQIKPTTYYE